MAKKQILVSDLSGAEISEEEVARVAINTTNGKRYELDVALSEVSTLVSAGREVKKRGRPKKAAS